MAHATTGQLTGALNFEAWGIGDGADTARHFTDTISGRKRSGQFVISLDFELMWGVRDHASIAQYGDAVMGGRKAIPQILALFAHHGIRATWATVGFLFAANKRELRAMLPEVRPHYDDPRLDPYQQIDLIGDDEASDPYWYGRSLVDQIRATPGQEIATHSMSHFYALEAQSGDDAYLADLTAAVNAAKALGIETRSIVFPRNQYSPHDIETASAAGLLVYRGNPEHAVYRPASKAAQSQSVRARRLIDALMPTGIDVSWEMTDAPAGPINVPASRFFRPSSYRIVDALRTRRILSEMTRAARQGRMYHLWWHPHNFGRNTPAMLRDLATILAHYGVLADRYGMTSMAMGDFADEGLTAVSCDSAATA